MNRIGATKTVKQHRDPVSILLSVGVMTAATITVFVLAFIIFYIVIRGVPHLSFDMFSISYNTTNLSLMPAMINTVIMTLLSLLIAVPIGICSAIYLVEYAKRGNKFVGIIRITSETLSGIPSIVYGLFGMLFFVTALGWRLSIMSGAATLSIMILPLIMRTTEEALRSVPDSYREGSFGLGAGRLRTVFTIVLPAAAPGILSGVILAIGRIVGESAALIFTAGSVPELPKSLFDSGRTLAVHLYNLSSEGLHVNEAFATAVVLLAIVVFINWGSRKLANHLSRA